MQRFYYVQINSFDVEVNNSKAIRRIELRCPNNFLIEDVKVSKINVGIILLRCTVLLP